MNKTDKQLPLIHERKIVAKSGIFKVERVDLEFSNGAKRQFERMAGSGRGAVMIVPLLDDNTLLLIKEYAAGTHRYELGFPKGLVDVGETSQQAANRELKEEVGFGARELIPLHQVSMAPTFFNAQMDILIARDLYPESLEGDEPEPLDKVPWSLSEIDSLLSRPDFNEARSIAALLLAHKWLKK